MHIEELTKNLSEISGRARVSMESQEEQKKNLEDEFDTAKAKA